MSKEILFTNGAIQNRDYTLDDRPEKAVGIVAAQTLNYLADNDETVHCWNDVGLFAASEPGTADERLAKKYDSRFMVAHLSRWQHNPQDIPVLRDTDRGFASWAGSVVESSLAEGTTYLATAEFIACRPCDMTIAEASVAVRGCLKCGGADLKHHDEAALFTDLPDDRRTVFPYDGVYNKSNLRHEFGALDQLPPRLLLSRDRPVGVGLEDIGLADKVLDPRLGIGLLAVYAAATRGYNQAGMVQSRKTFVRTAPYIGAVISDGDRLGLPRPRLVLHSLIDPQLLRDPTLTDELLALHALQGSADVRANNRQNIIRQRDGIIRKSEAIAVIAERLGVRTVEGGQAGVSQTLDRAMRGGDLQGILPTAAKTLGRALEDGKHIAADAVTDGQRAAIAGALVLGRKLEPVLAAQSS